MVSDDDMIEQITTMPERHECIFVNEVIMHSIDFSGSRLSRCAGRKLGEARTGCYDVSNRVLAYSGRTRNHDNSATLFHLLSSFFRLELWPAINIVFQLYYQIKERSAFVP